MSTTSSTLPSSSASKFALKFTRSKLAERRLKGLCFSCDEPFTQGHRCKVFHLELLDDPDDVEFFPTESFDEQLEISLNAIIGISAAQNMLLVGFLGDFPFKALIDSGSTHCFISEKVV